MQKYNWHCPEQAKSEPALQNGPRSVILRSCRSPRRNGDCPENQRVHRSIFIKVWHTQLRHSLRSLAFKDKAVYSRLTCTGLLASVLGCICFR